MNGEYQVVYRTHEGQIGHLRVSCKDEQAAMEFARRYLACPEHLGGAGLASGFEFILKSPDNMNDPNAPPRVLQSSSFEAGSFRELFIAD